MPSSQTRKLNGRRVCPKGYIKRKAYTRKNTGTHVKSVCIRSTSPYTQKATNKKKTMRQRLGSLLGTAKRCPPGTIARSAYVRKVSHNIAEQGYTKRVPSGKVIKVYPTSRSVFVPATCVKDVGQPGKGTAAIGPLRKGELQRFGYAYKLPEAERQMALGSAVRELGALNVYRKLDAVAKLSKVSNPKAARIFAADRHWVRVTYGQEGVLRAF